MTARNDDYLDGYLEEQLRLASNALQRHRLERQQRERQSTMDGTGETFLDRYLSRGADYQAGYAESERQRASSALDRAAPTWLDEYIKQAE